MLALKADSILEGMIPLRDDVPTRIAPTVTVLLVVLNVAVFLYELSLEGPAARAHGGLEQFIERFAVVPRQLVAPQAELRTWLTPLTSMFLHGGFLHVAGNMLYLWIFGNNVEDLLGHARYLVFYLFCGLVAAATQVATAPTSSVPVIGASGAVSGVLGAYAVSYPTARIRTLIPLGFIWTTVYLPALVLLALWFAMQVFSGALQGSGGGGVAWWAHVGGFVAGAVLVKPFRVRPPVRQRIPI
ncbi:MAG TPA: rhomboid family intramembrane serine protease [Candidatus Bathyarchaeia archaeon]|nr:rhomboid family intramembrane serine protease [Candidatus Bathyarchaeia archaeon]